ncbi:hypothetical protein [Clavibacter sp. VKM Ac-2872]|uniref:hypothetical protein n=1 Tax=Clavibacter sp. VKM Ac-2872 TaxID=2783812 RepID=UPI00188C5620|nr:hypothetical protein [Clavibacter sp. VKM Ac-2872]MBF4624726.1 hypothetical protein [Clavibacter sp. VKM Ac-2872]
MRSRSAALALSLPALLLAGCSSVALTAPTMPPTGELTATATVLQRTADDGAMLCAGGTADSLPPLCGGPVIAGWDWDAVDDEETVSGVTWGDYDVVGTWDGTTFTLTRAPVPTSEPTGNPALPTPWPDPADQASVDRALADYGQAMTADAGAGTTGFLGTGDAGGRAEVDVFYDDGTMQAEADATYGADVVVIDSALRPVERPGDGADAG